MFKPTSTLAAQSQGEVFSRWFYTTNLSTKQKQSEKCLIKALLNNKLSSVLLSTGAQVSVISDKYLKENSLLVNECPAIELLDKPDT